MYTIPNNNNNNNSNNNNNNKMCLCVCVCVCVYLCVCVCVRAAHLHFGLAIANKLFMTCGHCIFAGDRVGAIGKKKAKPRHQTGEQAPNWSPLFKCFSSAFISKA